MTPFSTSTATARPAAGWCWRAVEAQHHVSTAKVTDSAKEQHRLEQLIEELRKCQLLLTNDTGTMHLATLLGVPVVAIFGSTEPSLTGPLGKGNRVVRHHVECSPCFLRECPLDFRCMSTVSAEEVVAAIRDS